MNRMPLRWLLAPLQLGAFVCLTWFGCPYTATWVAWLENPSAVPEDHASPMGTISFEYIDLADEPYLEQIATGINAPPVFAAELIAEIDDRLRKNELTGARRELLSHSVAAVLIPIFWFLAGRSIELRGTKGTAVRGSGFKRAGIIALVALCAVVAVIILGSLLAPAGQPSYISKTLLLGWLAVAARILPPMVAKTGRVQETIKSTTAASVSIVMFAFLFDFWATTPFPNWSYRGLIFLGAFGAGLAGAISRAWVRKPGVLCLAAAIGILAGGTRIEYQISDISIGIIQAAWYSIGVWGVDELLFFAAAVISWFVTNYAVMRISKRCADSL